MSDVQRLFPASDEAEKGVLCSLLLAPAEIRVLCEEGGITAEHFHYPHHATIFRRAFDQIVDTGTTDIVTLTNLLRDMHELETVGGAAFVTSLFTFLPTYHNARHYLEIIEQKHTLREIIKTGTEFACRGYDEGSDVPALLEGFEKAVIGIRRRDDGELREEEPKQAILKVLDDIEALYERRGKVSGQTTGFCEIDEMLDGLHDGEMIVIAARPSMGKTALGMNIAEHIAVDCKKTVAVFTLEMSTSQLYQRVVLSRGRVNLHRVRTGMLNNFDFPKIKVSATHIADGQHLRIIDAIGATINAIRAKARRMARKHPDLAAIVVDYLQKVRSTSRQAQMQREREIAEISAGLKDLAKELRIPVIVLAQLNREAEKRTGSSKGRPKLSDLRESGAIEQDADVVGLLYREEYYADSEEEKRDVEGKATLIIAKNRNGPVGDIPLTFLKEFARYENRARATEL